MKAALLWNWRHEGVLYAGRGARGLLDASLTAFFSSRQCPGTAIRAAMDWALIQARSGQPVVGGFHAPLEQSVLTLLLEARCPVVVVLARPVAGSHLPPCWDDPMRQGYLAAVSNVTGRKRLTRAAAARRNDEVGRLADRIVIAHANPEGQLVKQCGQWRASGKPIRYLLDGPA